MVVFHSYVSLPEGRENPVARDSGEVQEPNMPVSSPWARNSHAECINWAFSMAT